MTTNSTAYKFVLTIPDFAILEEAVEYVRTMESRKSSIRRQIVLLQEQLKTLDSELSTCSRLSSLAEQRLLGIVKRQ